MDGWITIYNDKMTKQFVINTETGEFEKDSGNLGVSFRKPPFRGATDGESLIKGLQEAKNSKIAEIEANRKAFIYLPTFYKETQFINSEKAGNNLQAAYSFIDEPITWLDLHGNTVTLSLLEVKELIRLMITHRSTGYFLESTLIKQVHALETTEEVAALNITFG